MTIDTVAVKEAIKEIADSYLPGSEGDEACLDIYHFIEYYEHQEGKKMAVALER